MERGLITAGRTSRLKLELLDKPGQLKLITRIIADCGANVTDVQHERAAETESVNSCFLHVRLETRDFEHLKLITDSLRAEGVKIIG